MKITPTILHRLAALVFVALLHVQIGFADIDTDTQVPSLILPASSSVHLDSLAIQYTLPEAALPGTVRILFMQGVSLIASLTMDTTLSVSATIDPFASSIIDAHVASSSGFPLSSGTYSVVLSYQDASANPAATATNTNVQISQVLPTPTATATASPTATPCVSSVALPKIKVKRKSATVTLTARKNVSYTVRATPIGSPTRRTKTIKFTATSKRKYLVTFLKLKAGAWRFYYSAKLKGGLVSSCAVDGNIAS